MPECRGLPDSLTRRGKDCDGGGMRGNFQEGVGRFIRITTHTVSNPRYTNLPERHCELAVFLDSTECAATSAWRSNNVRLVRLVPMQVGPVFAPAYKLNLKVRSSERREALP
jgi:hypothetical protein